jgi:ABC-type transport system involved in cytochrome c biogenesis permease component
MMKAGTKSKEFKMNKDAGAALFGTVFFAILAFVAFLFGFYPYPQALDDNPIRALGKVVAAVMVVFAVLAGVSGSFEHKE